LQAEAVIVGVAARLGADWRARAAMLEEVRNANHVTIGGTTARPHRKRKDQP